MSLATGTRLGPYEILAPIGAGGMGEVYRARDTRLGREVAIKVLPARLMENADARARFEVEARAVAALSHPHILAIHDIGEHEGSAYAVTELLEGETLGARLKEGPLPPRKALDLAQQMAEGLAAAHEKGIVHRDLKPANVFLTTDGRLKILDFGLAKTTITDAARPGGGATQTMALNPSTEPGTVLGTVHYMSPEQVRAAPADHRSDIFSFGAVLYEMLTAKQPFTGDSAVETMNAILREEPRDSSTLNPAVAPSVNRIIQRCLEKKPEQRFQSARDLAFALENTDDSSSRTGAISPITAPASRSFGGLRAEGRLRAGPVLGGVALLMIGGVIGAFVGKGMQAPAAAFEPVKVTPLTHSGHDWGPSASPDGRMLAFVSGRDGRNRIWLREMKGGNEVPLTEGNDVCPRFSPDGSSVIFLRGVGTLRTAYRVAVVGGQPRRILDNVSEAVWAPDGARVAFLRPTGQASKAETIIGIAGIQGGEELELARHDDDLVYGLAWSPDGKWLSASATSAVQNTPKSRLLVFDAATGAVRARVELAGKLSMATWDRGGTSLVLAQSLSLVGDTSNPVGRVLRLDPFTGRDRSLFWVQSVYTGGTDIVRFDAVADATFVFDEYDWRGTLREVEMTGAPGLPGGRLLTQGNSRDRQPAYSRAGDMVIFSSNRSGNLDLWTLNLKTDEVRQITDDAAEDWDPAFTADGRGILWSSSRGGHLEIWTASADGTGARQLTHDEVDAENPTQTRDGAYVVYASGNPKRQGVWRIKSDGTQDTQLASGTYFLPEVSPDGRHVAYAATDAANNRSQVLVSEIATGKLVFTTDLAFLGFNAVVQPGRPRWMPDGRTLVFVSISDAGRGILAAQDFRPGEDTTASRRVLVATDPDVDIESFGISPDGRHVTTSRIEGSRSLKLAEGVPGLK